jgi:hypothetical protein
MSLFTRYARRVFTGMAQAVCQWVGDGPRLASPRLGVQLLEARDCPAAYYWSPINGLGTGQPDNWLMGQGLPALRHTYPPNGDDHLYFGPGWSGGNSDAYLRPSEGAVPLEFPPPVTELNFAGVHLLVGYTYRVTNQTGDLLVGTFNMHGGSLRQADSELMDRTDPPAEWPIDWVEGPGVTALTVDSTFYWTGGTINDGDLAGELNLAPGATGLAEPSEASPINWTVELGSRITLMSDNSTQSGSTLQSFEGIYNLKNGANFVITDRSSMHIKAPVPKPTHTDARVLFNADPVTHTVQSTGMIEAEGGELIIECDQQPRTSSLPALVQFKAAVPKLLNTNGTVKIRDNSVVQFTPSEGDGDGGGIRHDGFSGPVTQIEAGCKVIGEQKTNVRIDCGSLELTALLNEQFEPVAVQPQIVISAPNADRALDVVSKLGRPEGRTVTVGLKVEGVFGAAGELQFWADRTRGDADLITVTKRVIWDGAEIDAQWFASAGSSATAPTEWDLIRVTSQAVGDKIEIDGLPVFDPPSPAADFVPTLFLSSNEKKLGMERKP